MTDSHELLNQGPHFTTDEENTDPQILRLQARIERLTEMVEERNARLVKLIDQQKNLVRHLSHDLKTPLTPLVAILPLMRAQIYDGETKEMLDVVIDSVGYINAIVEQALELAQVSTRDFKAVLGEVDLCSILETVLARYDFAENNITLQNSIIEELSVQADSLLLDEVLDNLLSNAIKFMGGPGVISIAAKRVVDRIIVTVADTGSGMTDDEVAQIFDEFFKADPARHDLASTGLGMSKCGRLVEKLGGQITVRSAGKDCGTTVCFTLKPAEGAEI